MYNSFPLLFLLYSTHVSFLTLRLTVSIVDSAAIRWIMSIVIMPDIFTNKPTQPVFH